MATRSQVSGLYKSLLGREPDSAGLDYWVNSGFSLGEIESRFRQTPEFIENQQMQIQAQRMAQQQAEVQRQAQAAQQQAAQQAAQQRAAQQAQAQAEAQRVAAQQQAAQQAAQQLAQQQAAQAEAQRQAQAQQALPTLSQPATDLVTQMYQQQLGRNPDPEGAAYWNGLLANGANPADVAKAIAQTLEGQNTLTQAITSAYRQELGRNPEQEGYQYWQSSALNEGLTTEQIRQAVAAAAQAEQAQRNITGGITQMELAALEADPYGGRYATTDIFALPSDAVNVSTIGDRQAQFVAPVTQQSVISNFGGNQFSATPGQDVLSNPVVLAAIERATNSGALSDAGLQQIVQGLTTATDMSQVRDVFATPQAQVVVDAIYGQQTGEDIDLNTALAEAAQRQAVLDANDTGYYQNNFQLADAYKAAGLDFPFGQEAFQGYDTMMTQGNVVTPDNFNERINSLLQSISGQFGGLNDMQTPLTGQYYSETGLQPGYTPVGTPGTTFRSGVAGYVPQAQLPTGFQFGAPAVNATFQQYRPGAFQPEGVTTGGYITGYNANGTPIYSQYSNPNANVGGATSALNPFTPVQAGAITDLQAQLAAITAAQQAAANYGSGGG